MAVLLFDLDAGLAGALGGLLVLAPFFVFRYFKVMNDMMSFCEMCTTRVSGKVQCVEIGYESSLRFMGWCDCVLTQRCHASLSLSFRI